MSKTWPPPPGVEDVPEIAPEPDEYEGMPSLEQAAAPHVEAVPDSGPSAMPSAQPVQGSQDISSAPTLTLPMHWGPAPADISPEFLMSYLTAIGFTQEALNSAPPPPFFMTNQQINASTLLPPGFTIGVSPLQQASSGPSPTMPLWLSNFPTIYAGLSGSTAGQHDEDVWEDVPEDTAEDNNDEMPALENGNPLTTPPSVGLQASMMANFAESMAAMGGLYDQPSTNAPNGSHLLGNFYGMPAGLLAVLQHGASGSTPAPTTDSAGVPQNGVTSAGPAMPVFPVHVSFIVGTEATFTPGNALHAGSFTANNAAELAAETAAVGVDILDPTTGEEYPELHTHFWQSGGPLPEANTPASQLFHLGGVPPAAAEFLGPTIMLAGDPSTAFSTLSMLDIAPGFDATAFVDTLDRVDISDIAAENMRCPYCWLPFGTTDEDEPSFVFTPDPDDPPEIAARQIAFRDLLPFCAGRADNDPVRTPCGHLFGRGCLIETLEKVDTLCPTCRKELRSKPEIPKAAV